MLVKSKFQILTGVLAMYILSLPVILVFHSQTHNEHVVQTIKSDFDDVADISGADCQFCSFYFDQQLYVENAFTYQLDFFCYYFHENSIDTPVVVSQEQQYLRGPPII